MHLNGPTSAGFMYSDTGGPGPIQVELHPFPIMTNQVFIFAPTLS